MNYAKLIKTCRLCKSDKLKTILNFGSLPLGNDLGKSVSDSKKKNTYKLIVKQCIKCKHYQLGHEVQSNKLYATNYTYLTGIAPSFSKHFQSYSDWIIKKCNLRKNDFVLDVGSNDGTCLNAFKKRKLKVLGIDPAKLPSEIANRKGINTINEFFNDSSSRKIKQDFGQMDFITSHNVLAHIGNIDEVFKNIFYILKEGGYFCFEVGYFLKVVQNNYFDTIYHEHLDYHHAKPLVKFLNRIGFSVKIINTNKIQGGSLRILCKKDNKCRNTKQVKDFLKKEDKSIINDSIYMRNWSRIILKNMRELNAHINNKIKDGYRVCGYGAPTKASLVVKLAKLSNNKVLYTVEDNPLKINKYLPKTEIKIVPFLEMKKDPPDVIIVFAWNFISDIVRKLKLNKIYPILVILPLPKIRIIKI